MHFVWNAPLPTFVSLLGNSSAPGSGSRRNVRRSSASPKLKASRALASLQRCQPTRACAEARISELGVASGCPITPTTGLVMPEVSHSPALLPNQAGEAGQCEADFGNANDEDQAGKQ